MNEFASRRIIHCQHGRWLGIIPKAHILRGSLVVRTRLGLTRRHAERRAWAGAGE